MPEGKRYTPENPSPAMKSFAAYIKEQGYDDTTDLETTVAATFVFHRDWQKGHASELVKEREEAAKAREEAKAKKAEEREQKKQEREAAKAEKEKEREAKKAEREAKKAEKEGADGDDSPADEPQKTSKRLRLKGGDQPAPECEAVGASSASF